MSISDNPNTPSLTPGDGTARRLRIARDLLSEAEAIGRLLDNQTAALGTNEILFLKRLRSSLLAKAEELGQMTGEPLPRPRAAPAPTAEFPRAEPAAVPAQPPPSAAVSPAAAAAPSPERDGRGALDLARIVVVSYLMFLFAFMGYLFAKSHLMRVDVSGEISDLLKVFLVPLVVLLLGFYFGSTRR